MTAPNGLPPVTQERIEERLDGFGLKHFRDDEGMTVTAFPGLACFFVVNESGFKVTTRWMATARSAEDVRTLRLAANDLNQVLPLVRVHPIVRDDNSAVALIEAPFFTAGGATDEQLTAMLEFYFSAIHHVASELTGRLPGISDSPESEA